MRDSYAPFEHVTRVQALRDFVDWLYDVSPETPSMPRETLLQKYWERVASEALQSAADAAHQRMQETHDAQPFLPVSNLVDFLGRKGQPQRYPQVMTWPKDAE